MNSDTGKSYTEPSQVEAAMKRGENLVPISERAAQNIKAARKARASVLRQRRKARNKMSRRSRAKNRR